jgi:hypothetical protein
MKPLHRALFSGAAALALAVLCFSGCEQPGGIRPEEAWYPDANTALRSLSVSVGNLTPPFDAAVTEYRVEVNHRVEALTIGAGAAGRNALVSGPGTLPLGEGETAVTVTVQAESGARAAYTLTVTRLPAAVIPIGSAAELAKIGVENGYSLAGDYELTADLILEDWLPAGTDGAHAFSGSFDGGGKTITLKSFARDALDKPFLGIFGYVKGAAAAKAAVKDLSLTADLTQASTAAAGQALGILAGYAEEAAIEGLSLEGAFRFSSAKNLYAGGIAGYARRGASIKDCKSSMTVTIDGGNGGGLAEGMYYNVVGGLAGLFRDGAAVTGCSGTGDVTADCTAADSQVFCGGIAGGSYYAFTTDYQGKIEDCSYAGKVTAKSRGNWSWAGGIAGCMVGGDGSPENTTRILGCSASGAVSTEDSGAEYPYAGGIVGCNYSGALAARSRFTGTVISNTEGNYSGGIAGYNSQAARIEDCWSAGEVTGRHNAGGIAGQNQVNAAVRRCYSRAKVICTDTCETNKPSTNPGAGGIAGYSAGTLPDALGGCAALNAEITAAAGTKIHRVAGEAGALHNNYGWDAMPVSTGAGSRTPDTGPDRADGEDCAAAPPQSFYEGLGWNFSSVWVMGGGGYPLLR